MFFSKFTSSFNLKFTVADLMDGDAKSDILTSPEREPADDDHNGGKGSDSLKKRKRKPYRPGKESP